MPNQPMPPQGMPNIPQGQGGMMPPQGYPIRPMFMGFPANVIPMPLTVQPMPVQNGQRLNLVSSR
jgi:hypothetical protein